MLSLAKTVVPNFTGSVTAVSVLGCGLDLHTLKNYLVKVTLIEWLLQFQGLLKLEYQWQFLKAD